ncbi:hypothetical protein N9W09_00500 [Crocinitomicaceae bacterium]|nr:hypothetical protein [Crocinitomicaceae bacterium]
MGRFRVTCIIEQYVDADDYEDAIEIGRETADWANAEWIADKTGENDG